MAENAEKPKAPKGKDDDKLLTKEEKKKKEEAEDMSEEDLALKEEMELLVTRVSDPEPALRLTALETMVKEVRTATSSMTSVPKPLKFLRPHYPTLKVTYASAPPGPAKTMLADVLSLLAMTMAEDGVRESLNYKLLGSRDDLGSWGHEYVRHLAGEIGAEYNDRLTQAEAAEAAKPATDAKAKKVASKKKPVAKKAAVKKVAAGVDTGKKVAAKKLPAKSAVKAKAPVTKTVTNAVAKKVAAKKPTSVAAKATAVKKVATKVPAAKTPVAKVAKKKNA